jgi:hypothetical protein
MAVKLQPSGRRYKEPAQDEPQAPVFNKPMNFFEQLGNLLHRIVMLSYESTA